MKTPAAWSKILGTILLMVVLPCIAAYFLWGAPLRSAVSRLVEVQRCETQMHEKLDIKWTYLEISDYAVSLLHSGMTRAEVKEALETIAPLEILRRSSDVADVDEILLIPCGNRFKNVVLYLYYSPDGVLERVENAFAD